MMDLSLAFAEAVGRETSVVDYDGGVLLSLPWSLTDGEAIVIHAREAAPGLIELTDRGLVADSLATVGLDLDRKNAASEQWQALRASSVLATPISRVPSRYEIAASCTPDEVGAAIVHLSEWMLRADGLRLLSRPTSQLTLGDRLVRQAQARQLPVTPKAPLAMRHGGQRQATCRVDADRPVFMQTLGDAETAYDHARALFGDADAGPARLVAVVGERASLKKWQRQNLEEFSTVLDEQETQHFLDSLAA